MAFDHLAIRNSASDRSSRAEIHNPLLRPLVARRIGDLPEPMRQELVPLLKELSADARGRTEASWGSQKAPMAVYWKAVSVYAMHLSRIVRPKS